MDHLSVIHDAMKRTRDAQISALTDAGVTSPHDQALIILNANIEILACAVSATGKTPDLRAELLASVMMKLVQVIQEMEGNEEVTIQ